MASQYDKRIPEMTRNLVRLYRRATDTDIVSGVAWYPAAWRIVGEWSRTYGCTESTVACVIAAISPQCSWERNLIIADDILADRPISIGGALNSNVSRARAIKTDRADALADYFKSGPKVTAFALNLQGYTDVVTVDTHGLQAALADVQATVSLHWQPYQSFQVAYIKAARKLQRSPMELQAIIWHTWKRLHPWGTKQKQRQQWYVMGDY